MKQSFTDHFHLPSFLGFFFFFFKFFIFLFYCLGVLGLHCCMQTFSSCGEEGLLSSWSARASHCSGFSCWGALDLGSQASAVGPVGSVAAARRLSCPEGCEIFPDQWLNVCPLYCKADSYPLGHQGSTAVTLFLFCSSPLRIAMPLCFSYFLITLLIFSPDVSCTFV